MQHVGLFRSSVYDSLVEVTAEDAVSGMLTLSRRLGVLAGPTSGATFTVAVNQLKKIDLGLDRQLNAVFIVSDRMESYMSYLKKHRVEFDLDNIN